MDAAKDSDLEFLHSLQLLDKASTEAFCRALGFRRTGGSYLFCRAEDPNHPSRALAAEDDFDPEAGKEPKKIPHRTYYNPAARIQKIWNNTTMWHDGLYKS
ncbi:hypothetical protein ACMFMF_007510 [Clarireedia jacksonii]